MAKMSPRQPVEPLKMRYREVVFVVWLKLWGFRICRRSTWRSWWPHRAPGCRLESGNGPGPHWQQDGPRGGRGDDGQGAVRCPVCRRSGTDCGGQCGRNGMDQSVGRRPKKGRDASYFAAGKIPGFVMHVGEEASRPVSVPSSPVSHLGSSPAITHLKKRTAGNLPRPCGA